MTINPLDLYGTLIAAGLMDEREVLAVMGADAIRRGWKGEKAQLAATLRAAVAERARARETQRAACFTEISDLIERGAAAKAPSRAILAACKRHADEWTGDGAPVVLDTELRPLLAETLALVVHRLRTAGAKPQSLTAWVDTKHGR